MKRLALTLFFCTLLAPLGIWAQAPPAADSYVASSAPTTSYGTTTILTVQNGVTSFVQFNLSAIPPGQQGKQSHDPAVCGCSDDFGLV